MRNVPQQRKRRLLRICKIRQLDFLRRSQSNDNRRWRTSRGCITSHLGLRYSTAEPCVQCQKYMPLCSKDDTSTTTKEQDAKSATFRPVVFLTFIVQSQSSMDVSRIGAIIATPAAQHKAYQKRKRRRITGEVKDMPPGRPVHSQLYSEIFMSTIRRLTSTITIQNCSVRHMNWRWTA